MTPGFHSIHFSPSFGGAGDLEVVVAAAAAAGFASIGLDLASVDRYIETGGSLERLADLLQAAALDVSDVIALSLRPGTDPVALAERLELVIRAVQAPLCVAAVSEAIGHDRVVADLAAALDVLAGGGVRLAVEFGGYMGLRTLDETVAVCAELGWERAGVLVDSYQCFRAGTTLDEIGALDSSQIALVQFADAAGPRPAGNALMTEARHARLIPGAGDLALHDFVDAVAATGYCGPLTAEVLSDQIRASDPGMVARDLYTAMAHFTADWRNDRSGRSTTMNVANEGVAND